MKLVFQLAVHLTTEPGLVFSGGILGVTPVVDGVLVVWPEAQFNHNSNRPLKDLSHPLQHALEVCIKPYQPSVKQQQDCVSMEDNIDQDIGHLLNKDFVVIVRVPKSRCINHLQ